MTLRNQNAIEADIINNHPVRQVFDGKRHQVVVAIAFDLEHCGNGLAGRDSEVQRRRICRIRYRLKCDKQLRLLAKFDFAKIINVLPNGLTIDCGRGYYFTRGISVIWLRCIQSSVDCAFRFGVSRLNHQWI